MGDGHVRISHYGEKKLIYQKISLTTCRKLDQNVNAASVSGTTRSYQVKT